MVTVGYEQERGLREKYERPDGYQVSASKTVAVPLPSLYAAWHDPELRGRWLRKTPLEIRTETANKSMRITWRDGSTRVEVNFYDKAAGKSQVTVQHSKLPSAREAKRMKEYWGQKLDRLKRSLEEW